MRTERTEKTETTERLGTAGAGFPEPSRSEPLRPLRLLRPLRPLSARKRPAERNLDPRARRHHNVPVLGLDGPLRSDRAADDAADHGALGVAADHAAHDRA